MSPGPSRRFGGQARAVNSKTSRSMRRSDAELRSGITQSFLFDQEGPQEISESDATHPLTPLDLSLAPFKMEDNDEDNVINDDESLRELGPAACQTINEDELDDVEGMPTRAQWKTIVQVYLASLHPTKRHKSLISQEFYKMIFRTLRAPDATRLGTPQFRFWARKMFQLVEAPNSVLVVTNGGRPVAIKEHIYDILCMCHSECGHGGRDKTCKVLREYYTWVPKELISNFVKACPTCAPRKVVHSRIKDQKTEAISDVAQEILPAPRFSVERLRDFGQLPSPPSDESRQLKFPPPVNGLAPVSVFQYEHSKGHFIRAGPSSLEPLQNASLPSPWTGNLHVTLPPLNSGSENDDIHYGNNPSDGDKHLSLPPLMQFLSRTHENDDRRIRSAEEGHDARDKSSNIPIDPALLHTSTISSNSPSFCNNQRCLGCQAAPEQHENALHLQLHPTTAMGSSHYGDHQPSGSNSFSRAADASLVSHDVGFQWEFPSVASIYGGAEDNSAMLSASTASIGLPTPSGSGLMSPDEQGHASSFQYFSPEVGTVPSFVAITQDGRLALRLTGEDGLETKAMFELSHPSTPPLLSPQPLKLENTNAVMELTAAALMDETHE